MTVYIQKIKVISDSRSGWDSYSDEVEKVFINESIEVLGALVKSFVKENTYSRYGDFGICLGSSECVVSEVEKYVEVKE